MGAAPNLSWRSVSSKAVEGARQQRRARAGLPVLPDDRGDVPVRAAGRDVYVTNYTIYQGGISGGKDSTALMLWMLQESGYPKDALRFTWCDTGNEAKETHAHVKLLSDYSVSVGGPPVITLNPELDFYALCIKRQIFPSAKRRFCTTDLKLVPSRDYCYALENDGHKVLVHTGVRASERSTGKNDRSKLLEWDIDTFSGLPVYRPLLQWTIDDVWAIHARYGIPRNPLYDIGMSRVGCFPCVMSNKRELRNIAKHRPERIEYMREKEATVQAACFAAHPDKLRMFFHSGVVPLRYRTGPKIVDKKGKPNRVATIDDVFRWALTSRGGGQFDMDFDEPVSCASSSGMCE
jgi:3'-phosphoadenosine 5'-phosphosulfate sulfotransferase (PAPS reductase)/FAD synthetase